MSIAGDKTRVAPYRGVEPGPGFDQIADDLATLIAREHVLRRRGELAADGLVVLVTHLLQEIDELRESGEELSLLLAREKGRRDELEEVARRAVEHGEAESSWRRRFKAADRRGRRRMLEAGR
jgi:hypothetical protein